MPNSRLSHTISMGVEITIPILIVCFRDRAWVDITQ